MHPRPRAIREMRCGTFLFFIRILVGSLVGSLVSSVLLGRMAITHDTANSPGPEDLARMLARF